METGGIQYEIYGQLQITIGSDIVKIVSQNMPVGTAGNRDRITDVTDRIKEKLPDESRSNYCVSNSPDCQRK
jgi:hypothetical protein